MHSFDTGMSKSARKNNWVMLERIFAKREIPISAELVNNVSIAKAQAGNLLISIIYWHVHNMNQNSKNISPAVIAPKEVYGRSQEQQDYEMISVTEPNFTGDSFTVKNIISNPAVVLEETVLSKVPAVNPVTFEDHLQHVWN